MFGTHFASIHFYFRVCHRSFEYKIDLFAKESENASVNLAERRADYWNFGGIFRPVFLEVKPAVNLRHIAIDAKMDGTFRANCYTNISNDGMSIRTQILEKKGKR